MAAVVTAGTSGAGLTDDVYTTMQSTGGVTDAHTPVQGMEAEAGEEADTETMTTAGMSGTGLTGSPAQAEITEAAGQMTGSCPGLIIRRGGTMMLAAMATREANIAHRQSSMTGTLQILSCPRESEECLHAVEIYSAAKGKTAISMISQF